MLAAAAGARADGLSLFLEPTFSWARVQNYDQLGNESSNNFKILTQNYRLTFDRQLTPAIGITAGGLYGAQRSWSTDPFGASMVFDGSLGGAYARLNLTLPTITGGLSYDWSETLLENQPPLVSDALSLYATWRPWDLPEFVVRVSRTHQFDTTRLSQDTTTWSALLNVRWPVGPFEGRYTLQWARPYDAVTGTEASALNQTLQGIYSDRIFSGRSNVYASVTLRNQATRTLAAGSGSVIVQQNPVAGLSLIETFPSDSVNITLAPNPALVDGNVTSSAAVDLGYAPTLAGDANRRDMGVQFADQVTPVNLVYVWVDRKLPPEVSVTYTWTAYTSPDNKTWTPVAITGPVIFAPFQNRFEIPVAQVQARYLKVVTQPLPAGVTLDAQYANIFVTELQVLLSLPADSIPRELVASGILVNLTASTLLWRAANLSWDLTTRAERRTNPGLTTWSVLNSFSASQFLARGLQLTERIARQDGDDGLGHDGQTDWSAGLLWRPLPTFAGSLIYSGQFIDSRPVLDVDTGLYVNQPYGFLHSVTALGRADLFEGVSLMMNGTGSLQSLYTGVNTWSGTLNTVGTVAPNRWVTFTLGWLWGLSIVQEPEEPSITTPQSRVDASITLRPTSAISLVGTVTRVLAGGPKDTFGSIQANWTPLQGDLQLGIGYSKTFDTASQSTVETLTPSARWNVRPGIQLTGSYTLLNTAAMVSRTNSRFLSLGLSIIL